MPAKVEQLTHEPIIVIQFDDNMDAQAIIDAYAQNVGLAKVFEGRVYRVIDIRAAESSFASVVSTWTEITKSIAGAIIVPTMHSAFVGQAHMTHIFADTGIFFFESMDEAIAHARSEVASLVMRE